MMQSFVQTKYQCNFLFNSFCPFFRRTRFHYWESPEEQAAINTFVTNPSRNWNGDEAKENDEKFSNHRDAESAQEENE